MEIDEYGWVNNSSWIMHLSDSAQENPRSFPPLMRNCWDHNHEALCSDLRNQIQSLHIVFTTMISETQDSCINRMVEIVQYIWKEWMPWVSTCNSPSKRNDSRGDLEYWNRIIISLNLTHSGETIQKVYSDQDIKLNLGLQNSFVNHGLLVNLVAALFDEVEQLLQVHCPGVEDVVAVLGSLETHNSHGSVDLGNQGFRDYHIRKMLLHLLKE